MRCGVYTGAEARGRWGAGALSRASHGGGEVVAVELDWAAWRGEEGSSAEGSGAKGSRRCHVWRWGSRSCPAALLDGGRRRFAPAVRGSREGEVEDEGMTFLQFLKSSGILL